MSQLPDQLQFEARFPSGVASYVSGVWRSSNVALAGVLNDLTNEELLIGVRPEGGFSRFLAAVAVTTRSGGRLVNSDDALCR